MEVGTSCPKEMLYLETGSTPIRYIIKFRRLMFLHYILNEDVGSLIYRVFNAQKNNPSRNDWTLTVEKDLEDLEIMLDLEEIQTLTRFQFKNFLKKSITEKDIEYLNKVKMKHTKVLHITHEDLKMQAYLEPKYLVNSQLAKFLFQARSRMLE